MPPFMPQCHSWSVPALCHSLSMCVLHLLVQGAQGLPRPAPLQLGEQGLPQPVAPLLLGARGLPQPVSLQLGTFFTAAVCPCQQT